MEGRTDFRQTGLSQHQRRAIKMY